MGIKKSILLRVRISFILVFLFSIAIVYRIFDVQYVEGAKWKDKAKSISLKYEKLKATRGNIYSDNGSLLATSLPFYNVAMDPTVIDEDLFKKELDDLCYELEAFFEDRSATEFKRLISYARENNRQYIRLSRKQVDFQEKKSIESWPIFNKGRNKGGIIFEKVDERFLPFSNLGYRTIGNINAEGRGVVGLEYSFNRQLAGTDGEALFQKITGGGWKPVFDGHEIRPKDGYDVHTTIDVNIQDEAQSALLSALVNNDADYGSVVVMEVATGEIKAISNLSKNNSGNYSERYNYAVGSQGSREPGSTFKLASMIALFEDTDISLHDSIDTGNGEHKFYSQVMKDHKPGGYGMLSVQEVFEVSSNIGTAKLITDQFGDDPKRFVDYIKELGLTETLDFQLVGEGKPYIKDPSDSTWSGLSLPWMSHGYELKMTPLQTLTLYNAVANEGKMMQPIIVKSVNRADRKVEKYKSKVLNEQICSKNTLTKLKAMLEGVVERGTATNISDSYYQIAGKTGTAKKVKDGRYTNKYYASFVGYFPAEAPKYSCIVVIDNPKKYRIYGSDVAAPVFKEIADKIYSMDIRMQEHFVEEIPEMGVFPLIKGGNQGDLAMLCNELGISNHSNTDSEWVRTKVVDNSVLWDKRINSNGTVPDVRGMTLRDAIYLLENKGLEVDVKGFGRVDKQSMAPGARIEGGAKIELELS